MGTTEKIMTVFFVVFGIVPLANALTVRLSLDGINPAPETIDVVAGQVLKMYVISDSDGISYWEWLTIFEPPATISNVVSYPAAGDLSSVNTTDLHYIRLTADDSADNIQAGIHFSFDLIIAPDAKLGTKRHMWLHNAPDPDDWVVFTVIPEPATTYYVDALNGDDDNDGLSPQTPFATIQKAIDSAYNGDTVLVADGTYTGPGNRDIDFLGKAITVRSESGPENCIIDCENSGGGFNFHSGEDANSVVDGFTITNGRGREGGGIYCRDSSPTITNCIITGNSARDDGGGIYCFDSNPTIANCTIRGNSADDSGGGIYCLRGRTSGGNPTITNCIITGNSADDSGGGIHCLGGGPMIINCTISGNTASRAGGGVYSGGKSEPSITNCTISGNTSALYGGGIACDHFSTPTLTNCKINGNTAGDCGGGIYSFDSRSNPTITNCTIAGNKSQRGAGVCCLWGSSSTITNCVLWGNEAPDGPQIFLEDGSSAWLSYTDVQDGQDGVYIGSGCILNWGEGNIDEDPCFVEPGYWDTDGVWVEGDYHLLRTSPCIDAANDANVYTDIEGNIRPFDFPGVDNNGELPEFDMGAYELVPIDTEMKLVPQMLNCSSKGKWIKAHFVLPEGFLPEDVDIYASAVAEPIGAESEYIELLGAGKGPVRLEVVFDREAFCDGLTDTDDGSLEITVSGSFTTSRYFRGTDTIKIKPGR